MPYFQLPDQAPLYTAAQTRELDRLAIASGIAGFELMQRAGRSAYRVLRQRWPEARSLAVLCGPGNNGGDGFIIAGLAQEQQLSVSVYVPGGEAVLERLRGEALEAYYWARAKGVVVQSAGPGLGLTEDVIVDALLGTGLTGPVRGDYVPVIEAVNAASAPVLAVDIPSGLCADTGRELGCAVRADCTISFIGLKRGLFTHRGPDCAGALRFDDLQVPATVYDELPVSLRLADAALLQQTLKRRRRSAHKGDFGHVLVVGGDYGMAGALILAATAAARSGAGLVSAATRPEHLAAINARCPEVMAHGVASGQALAPLLERATVVLLGPGLGQSAWSGQLLHAVQASELPLVLDADALNLLNQGELVQSRQRSNWVLTPHPGEAARLLDCDTAAVQADRFAAVNQLQERYGGVSVLKGAGTLIANGRQLRLCHAGNPGMGSGGMGDVLGGLIAGLLAQKMEPSAAASCAVAAHALAGDEQAAVEGERGLLASDLLVPARRLLNPRVGD
ncbi:NAD(P)H-hydrate dehydratase [Motiliproteus sp. SC1-56]|uniref:NAD(P)H-hydrate dehydratase n=1 Tax=Motiliproteus sp. SC1-56 TaxID=2799565 RepID=UPI001A8EE4D5|nr:NAD(P)H-hydrate dehydratase [Motiliproteus sp. SC1-56]